MKFTFRLLGVLAVLVVVMFATSSHAHHAQYYVLDGFGGVHAGGGAPAAPAGVPYFGFDIAKGIAYIPSDGPSGGDGVVVLDGFGGVHTAGIPLPVAPASPYFGFDIARAITYRNIPPRSAGAADGSIFDLSTTSSSFSVIESVSITAPDDGYLIVNASAFVGCFGGGAVAVLTINVDATTEPAEIALMGQANLNDCAGGNSYIEDDNQSLTHLFPVNAGQHTVNFLGRRKTGVGTVRILGRAVTAIYVDHGAIGTSAPAAAHAVDPTLKR